MDKKELKPLENEEKRRARFNSPLESELLNQLIIDYCNVQTSMTNILRGKRSNQEIFSPDYIEPTLDGQSVPLSNPKGEFAYFWRIRTALELAMVTGSVPGNMMPANSPRYLKELKKEGTVSYDDMFIG